MIPTHPAVPSESVDDAHVELAPTEAEAIEPAPSEQEVTPHISSVQSQPIEAKKRGQRKSLTSARRELSEKEFSSPAVLKLILDDLDRLEEDKSELASFREEYHRVDKAVAVLTEKFKTNVALEVLSLGSITVGAAAIGYAPNVWNAGGVTPYLLLAFGVLLVASGIGAKAVKI